MIGIWGIFYLATYVWKVPELEYKYKKGEILYYAREEKQQGWKAETKYMTKGTPEDNYITVMKIKDITQNGEYMIGVSDLANARMTWNLSGIQGEDIYFSPNKMSRKGDTAITAGGDMFLGSQPMFTEGKVRGWKKTIYVTGYDVNMQDLSIPCYYKVVRKIFGKKNTYRINVAWKLSQSDNMGNTYSSRLKGYSDFDADAGKIIQIKSVFESRMNEELSLKKIAKWNLLSDDEIFKLSGLEKNWELVVPGVKDFELSVDGKKLVYETNPTGRHGDEEFWIADADGDNAERLAAKGGSSPKWSQDSSMIAYIRTSGDNRPPYELHVIDLLNNDKEISKTASVDYYWLPDGRLLFEEKLQNRIYQWKTINPKTGEIIEIDNATKERLYQSDREIDASIKKALRRNKSFRDSDWSYLWSPDRQIILMSGQYKPLKIRFLDGKEEILIPENKEANVSPQAWSPDGRFFIYRVEDRKTGKPDPTSFSFLLDMKYILDLYSLEKRKTVAHLTKWKKTPYITVDAWSSDGRYIYFGATHQVSSMFGIYRLRLPDEVVTKK